MKRYIENIRESEIEDALITYLDILKELININTEVRLITRQLRLLDRQKRLDILLALGDEIFLIELKTEEFHIEHIKQILIYKEELEKLQQEKKFIGGKIVPLLLVTNFKGKDFTTCDENGIRIYKYSPIYVLKEYYDRLASIAQFMKIKPVDIGVFNIGLINRVMHGVENGLITLKELSEFSKLSNGSTTNH